MPPSRSASLDDTRSMTQDASKMSFPLQLVILIVTTVISVALSVTGTTWSIKSDVRDMATRLEMREEADKQYRDILSNQLSEQKSQIKLLQMDVTDLKLQMNKR